MQDQPGRTLEPDLCVIGGGTAGHAVALAAAAVGVHCVVIDERERLGDGQAADLAEEMIIAAAHARAATKPDLHDLRIRIAVAVEALAPNVGADRLRAIGVTLIRSPARFADRNTVLTAEAAIRARRFIVATGARAARPAIAGAERLDLLAASDLARLRTIPERVAVLADGPAGYEWAQCLRRLGAEVTLLERWERSPARWDAELLETVRAGLRRDGVVLHLVGPQDVLTASRDGVSLSRAEGPPLRVATSHVLAIETPVPAIGGLDLDRAGVRVAGGAPVVGDDLRTSNRRVFAIGDVLGKTFPGGAAIPLQVGLVVRAALFRQPVRFRPEQVPVSLRTEPGLAQVGSLAVAAESGRAASRIYRWPFAENGRAVATDERAGHVKIRATPAGRVIGAGIVGPRADDLIVAWALAIARAIPLGAIAGLPVAAFSPSDVSRRAAVAFVAGRLRSPWIRRLVGFLQKLG